jgi:predicted nucleic acid-binding protein
LPDLVCNTSCIQYLHQLGLLGKLSAIADHVVIPTAVLGELTEGRKRGVDLPAPDEMRWIAVAAPRSIVGRLLERGADVLSLVTRLGDGETQVLALALERVGSVAALDDHLARTFAETLSIPLTGTLGLLLDLKRVGAIGSVRPCLDRLERLGFRLAPPTREAVLRLAAEDAK